MARETLKITKVTSDLSGEEGADTLTFTVNGTGYAIDLTETETKEFHEVISLYVTRAQVRPKRGGAVGKKSTPEELAQIRTWASSNGYDISPTARIPSAVRKAYDEAHAKPAKKAPAKKAAARS